MSNQIEALGPVEVREHQPSGTVKHCRSCWRRDIHINVPLPPFALGFLMVVTFGLVLFVRPSRCVCCGRMRIF